MCDFKIFKLTFRFLPLGNNLKINLNKLLAQMLQENLLRYWFSCMANHSTLAIFFYSLLGNVSEYLQKLVVTRKKHFLNIFNIPLKIQIIQYDLNLFVFQLCNGCMNWLLGTRILCVCVCACACMLTRVLMCLHVNHKYITVLCTQG